MPIVNSERNSDEETYILIDGDESVRIKLIVLRYLSLCQDQERNILSLLLILIVITTTFIKSVNSCKKAKV